MTIIRHCVEESNVDENFFVLDPTQVKHVIIIGGKIESMSGIIDTKSHLNLDYPDHKVSTCVIAEKFSVGSRIKIVDEGLVFARVDPADYKHYGQVDYTQRLSDMIEAVKGLRVEKEKTITSSKSI
jgi:hypothetical protein